MRLNFTSVLFCIILVSCKSPSSEVSVSELVEIEKAFSDMSHEKGMIAAFKYFADEEAVLLRDNNYPIVGRGALAMYLSEIDDSEFTLSWEVEDAKIAASGDLGYTYGIYTINHKADSIPNSKGTYITIWKKNEAGEWRFVMDTGQEGLKED